jgi:hypothetical protein
MKHSVALMSSGFLASKTAVLAFFAHASYRVLKPAPKRVPAPSQSRFARERFDATRSQYS